MNTVPDIAVVGGGPAGIFAAIAAAQHADRPRRILILDHNFMLGRKLLKTGNGRCNITNREIDVARYHGENTKFLHGVFAQFTNRDLLRYFQDLGVEFKDEAHGCIFPVTDQASTILDILKEEIARYSIEVLLNARVEKISRSPNGEFRIACSGDKSVTSRRLILATGGMAYPQIGALGDGYSFAEAFGHTVIPPAPALVALNIENKSLLDLQGVKADVAAAAYQDGKQVASVSDEMLFTHYGVSGPVVLHLSSFIARNLRKNNTLLRINFFPGLTPEKAQEKLRALWQKNPKRALGNSLIGILPKKLSQVLMRNVAGLNTAMRSDAVSGADRARILRILTNLEIQIHSTLTFKDAQVTSGGVRTDEINGRTMESTRVHGLYLAGELLDINGDCGGYNLQFAFSSGYIAGTHAAK
jgi:predicted Rossmann fold flavoprotein